MTEARSLITHELKQLKVGDLITAQQLQLNTKIALIQIYGIIKHLEELTVISPKLTESGKFYKVIDYNSLNTVFNNDPITRKKTESIGRNTSKFIYEEIPYSKSKCVLMIVSDYVKTHNPSLKVIKEIFPDSIVTRFGVIKTLKTAKELSSDRPRYYLDDHYILTTSDKKKIVVCNQWTLTRFMKFMKVAAKLGYRVKPT